MKKFLISVLAAILLYSVLDVSGQTTPALIWSKASGPWTSDFDGSFGTIAVDPANPNIILIGSSVLGPGVFKSTDGGSTWLASNTGIEQLGLITKNYPPISKIVISPSNPSVIYLGTVIDDPLAGAVGNIYKSIDGGASWSKLNQISGSVYDLDVHPQDPNTVFAGVAGQGVMKTTDGGSDWTTVFSAGSSIGALDYFNIVRVLPTQPSTVFFSGFTYYSENVIPLPDFETTGTEGVLPFPLRKSTDGGSTWSAASNPSSFALYTDLQFERATGNLYLSTIAYETPVFWPVGNSGIFKSSNAGQNWQTINQASFASLDQLPFVALMANPSSVNAGVFASGGLSTMFIGSVDGGSHWLNLDPCLLNAYIGRSSLAGNKLFILTSVGVYSTDASSLFTATSPTAPVISVVSPSALPGLPLPQTQLIKIFGSGFTSSSTLTFNDGVNPSYANKVPVFISANELDYYIKVGPSAANWTVQVVNGSQGSNFGTFTVVAPPPPSVGSLSVTLQPPGAVSAGAQWQVDGTGYNNSGQVVGYLTPGVYTVSFKSVAGYTAPASHSVSITGGSVTSDTETYSVIAPTSYILTVNQGLGNVVNSPSGSWNGSAFVYTAGSVVQLAAYAYPGYHFTGWSGDLSGSVTPQTTTMTGNKNVTANFASGDPREGTAIITIQPPAAAAAGVTWGHNANDFRPSGSSYTTVPGTYILTLHTVDGWLGPSSVAATITAGQTTNITVTFTPDTTPGLLTVVLTPPNAASVGATWHVNGGAAQSSGATVSLVPGSNYVITFDPVSGWTSPSAQTVTVQRAQTTVITGNYTPPVGQPLITAIQPSFGALAGGTPLTIVGVNFTAPVSVLIGGNVATNVGLVSPSQITCLAPSSSVYGTLPVIVQTPGGSATNLNGFAYGAPRGNGLDLMGAIGGAMNGVAVQGNYAYVGEGSSLLVVNISSSSSPTLVARLAMPGMVRDVALSGQYAYIADADAGLQVVDISSPSVPLLKGFYATPGVASGIAIQGGKAYVADDGGLEIFDLSNPIYPSRVSSANYNGAADSLAIQVNATNVVAYLSAGEYISVFDVTQPSSPIMHGHVHITGDSRSESIAVSGKYLFVASLGDGLHMIDVSNVDNPVDIGRPITGDWPSTVAVENSSVFTCALSDPGAGSGFRIFSLSGSTLTQTGNSTNITCDGGGRMVISGVRAYIASVSSGFEIVDISNPSSPSQLSIFSDSGDSHDFFSVAISSNSLCATVGADFQVFDVTQPTQPSLVGELTGIAGGQVLAQSGIVYLMGNGMNYGSTRIISITPPSSPQLLATIPFTAVSSFKMAVVGNRLYIVGDNGSQPRFAAFDVSTPSAPVLLGTHDYTSPGEAYSVAVSGNKAVVGIVPNSGTDFVSVLDISNISAPVEKSQIMNVGYPYDIAMSADGHYAYIADHQTKNFCVVDVSNTTNPVLVAKIPTSWIPQKLTVQGNLVYVASEEPSGVYVFDVSNPATPSIVKSYPTAGFAYDVAISPANPSLLYVANYDGGLAVLKMRDVTAPLVDITAPTSGPEYTTTTGSVNIAGSASDDTAVTGVTWVNSRGGGGTATGTNAWTANGIILQPGTNILTVTAYDAAGNNSNAVLAAIYQPPAQNQTIIFSSIADQTFGDPPIQLVASASSGLPVTFSVVSGSAALSSSNVLTLTGAGAVTLEADQSGNSSFSAATPVDVSFNVARASQSIAFTPVSDQSVGNPTLAVAATASSGLEVYFNVVSGPAVLNSNVVTLLGAGTVTINAWQPGNSNYNAAAIVQQSFAVTAVPQTIAFGPLSQQRAGDAPFPLAATASSGLPVSFALVSGPATLSGNILALTGVGTVTISASQSGDGTYAAASSVTQSFFVAPVIAPPAVGAPEMLPGGSFQVTFYGVIGSNYTFQASTDLKNWVSLFSFTCTNSPMYLVETNAIYYTSRFYRVAQFGASSSIWLGFGLAHPWTTNGLSLMLQGPVGSNYIIQASTDLINWQAMTNFVTTNSPFYFFDTAATNYDHRFYRGVMP